MNQPERRVRLRANIETLNDQEVIVVDDFVAAILTPVEHTFLASSWLVTPEWGEGFLARLRAHHALSEEPLSTTQFEAAFNAACAAAGWTVTPASGATNRFFDTTIVKDGHTRRISLKASSAKGMRRDSVHISKLTEAAWIQDTRRQADRRNELVRLFEEYRASTDGIVMLRGFHLPGAVLYELVEIPTDIFAAVARLSVEGAQASTIGIPEGAVVPSLKITVDRSDAKITLTGIRLDVCTVHGTWTLAGERR